MIISSAQVSLGHAQSGSRQLTQNTQTQIEHMPTTGNEINLVMGVSSRQSYDYSQYQRLKIEAQSEIRQGDSVKQYALDKMTEKLTQVSLNAEQAEITLQKAFPSGPTTDLKVSGEVAFNFTHQIEYRQNSNSFLASQGSVTLEDGREVSFHLMLSQQQATSVDAKTQIEFGLTKLKDPLVINFGRDTVQLQNTSFQFDMNGDGTRESYAKLVSGSGYLTFDVNGDGLVTDGSELFGAKTGDAYAELAQYDDDHNGWIDEHDAIFQRLKIWQDQSDPNATLSLTQAGVGAIYLGNADFSQELRGENGELLGQTKQAGVVLMENGEINTSQAIDLAQIQPEQALKKIENSQAFKQLKQVADIFNQAQQVRRQLAFDRLQSQDNPFHRFSIADSMNPVSWRQEDKPQRLFEQLQAYIEQELAARQKLLDWLKSRYGEHHGTASSSSALDQVY